jgi:tol-pal system protein YbgF
MGAFAQTALPPPSSTTVADAEQNRVEALERQLREATAENERLQFQLIQAQRDVARLQQVTGDLAAANTSLQAPATPVAPPQNTPNVISPAPSAAPRPPVPEQRSSLGELSVPATTPPDAAAAYSAARQLLLNGRTAEAETAFTDFLSVHGDATSAPDARYWLAFTYLARNNYQSAAASFVDYLQRYPTAARAPEAQVRLGMALIGMGQTRQGCAAFRDMPTRYPRASQAARDLATRESRAARCTA